MSGDAGGGNGRRPGHGSEPKGARHEDAPGHPRFAGRDPDQRPKGLESLADLLPRTAREHGLEEQLELARAAAAWDAIVAAKLPAAAGSCRLVHLERGVATIQYDLPIVAQEIRLRSPELLAALRSRIRGPVARLQLTARHV